MDAFIRNRFYVRISRTFAYNTVDSNETWIGRIHVNALSDGSDITSVSVVDYSDSNWTPRKSKLIVLIRLAQLIKRA